MEIEVNEADREAAASGYFAWCSGNPVIPDRMKAGNSDDHSMVQAFARHRQAAIKERDAQIVAWLREDFTGDDAVSSFTEARLILADAIERGEV